MDEDKNREKETEVLPASKEEAEKARKYRLDSQQCIGNKLV
jgi:hypothetical protein